MSRTPPVPPANRTPKGPQNDPHWAQPAESAPDHAPIPNNLELQDQEGNMHQNLPRRATRLDH